MFYNNVFFNRALSVFILACFTTHVITPQSLCSFEKRTATPTAQQIEYIESHMEEWAAPILNPDPDETFVTYADKITNFYRKLNNVVKLDFTLIDLVDSVISDLARLEVKLDFLDIATFRRQFIELKMTPENIFTRPLQPHYQFDTLLKTKQEQEQEDRNQRHVTDVIIGVGQIVVGGLLVAFGKFKVIQAFGAGMLAAGFAKFDSTATDKVHDWRCPPEKDEEYGLCLSH